MKIKPADSFIGQVVRQNGEAVVVLGTRRAESSVRAARMKLAEERRVRDHLSPHSSLPNAYIYSPIEDWSNDDVWLFLMQVQNPWGHNNKDLLTMYQGASADGECPLVIDTSTPSCGDSRFGCWVCTMVEKDKSMSAMIQNDDEKTWMEPLLQLRNELDEHDHDKRDFRRMSGRVQLYADRPIPGPYTQAAREHWLRRLLQAQRAIRENPRTPEVVRQIALIQMVELHEIRRIWVLEKHEIEDRLPEIYEEELGEAFPGEPLNEVQPFRAEEMRILRELCDGDDLRFELTRELLEVERSYRAIAKRANLFDRIEEAFRRSFYDDVDDATQRAQRRRQFDDLLKDLRERPYDYAEAAAGVTEVVFDRSTAPGAAEEQ
jgi:DNA sulfur modification protein DndC